MAPAHAESLVEQLKLTPAQAPFYNAWDVARRGDPIRMKALGQQHQAARSSPELVASWRASEAYGAEIAQAVETATDKLYAVLSSNQRAILDRAMLPKTEKEAPPLDPLPAGTEPKLPDPHAAARTSADWTRRPTFEELEAFYPMRALRETKAGTATITCDVTVIGIANSCVVNQEEPTGYGFGNATLEVANRFRFHPATLYGVPTVSKVTVPLRWETQEEPQAGVTLNTNGGVGQGVAPSS